MIHRRHRATIPTLLLLLAWTLPSAATEQILDSTGGPAPSSGLDGPTALATDSAGNVYVAALASSNAFVVSPLGEVEELIDVTGAGLGSPLVAAVDIEVDSIGTVFVVGRDSDNVFRIDLDGTITRILAATGDGAGNILDEPSAIAVDSAGRVFVAGRLSHNVFMVDPVTGVELVIDAAGAGVGASLSHPAALAVDEDDNLYVLGEGSDNVLRRTPGGTVSEILDAAGDGAGHAFDATSALAVGSDGSVFASSDVPAVGAGPAIFRVAPGGGISRFASLGFAITGLAVDSTGQVLAASEGGWPSYSFVAAFAADGTPLGNVIDLNGDFAGHALDGARGLAIAPNDDVLVTGLASDNVFRVPTGTYLSPDTDGDLIPDNRDNCSTFPNGDSQDDQRDVDQDGYGNRCDADFDQDGAVAGADFQLFANYGFGQPDPLYDLDGDGFVLGSDFGLFVGFFGRPLGPSGLACADPTIDVGAGDPPCLP